jgi:hypothetical protein
MASKSKGDLESKELKRAGRSMASNNIVLAARYHGIDLQFAPVYDVHAGNQAIGLVWKEGDSRFLGVPAHHQNQLYEGDTLEEVLTKLFRAEGL